ncbi:DUF6985 domain-containing protein [Hymenobacter humi]|uniref:DUF6985 domain-containing protein n=1 Tax=Hymenobacter humi TaxID=1411620 RepID=A0ABW2U633_9BACT
MAESFSSQAAGVLRLEAHFGDSWEAVEPLALPFFNGQQVAVTFECGAVPNLDFMQAADAALLNFLALGEVERLASTKAVLANYEWTLVNDGPPLPLDKPADIWQYVEPRHLHVFEDEEGRRTTSICWWNRSASGKLSTAFNWYFGRVEC